MIHRAKAISHDTFQYVTERLYLEDLRMSLARVAKQLKANKALESCKINGLLFLSLDADEPFHSRSRCCESCCQREIRETDAQGLKHTVIEYNHRYVFAQINGPKMNLLLDLEAMPPGEEEAQAALRLLGRSRRVYGVRFFDAMTPGAWHVKAPFLKAIEKPGWAWLVVLKQQRMEVFQEARQLGEGQEPDRCFRDTERNRQVSLWRVTDLDFSASYGCGRPVQVVHTHEEWIEKEIVGGKKTPTARSSDGRWMASERLRGYPVELIYQGGHRRWRIENKAFNELTQHDHLKHCYHHEPTAILARMLILMLGFVLFSAYAVRHSQPVPLGQVTMKALAHEMDLVLQEDLPWELWFDSG